VAGKLTHGGGFLEAESPMHDQRTPSLHGPGDLARRPAPVWVLVLGAVLLGLALMLTAFGPRQFEPVATRHAGVGPSVSGN
jgi:hypothetical protein